MMLADRQHKWSEAAVELRKVLDEKPGAARVRLELARMQAMMGRIGAAEKELRAASAAGLPPEVERMIRFYANALTAAKPFGGSLEVAIAPDSNINRATKSDTLGTVIGDFTLDRNARARSGVGLDLRGQAWLRRPLGGKAQMLLRLSGSSDLYRASDFDDIVVGVQAGPEIVLGRDKLTLSAGPAWRWYGGEPYSFTASASAAWRHPTGRRSQLRVETGLGHTGNKRNGLQDALNWSLSASLDRAFTARSGGGLQIYGARELAVDPGYSTRTGGLGGYLFRELGKTTAVLALGYSHLEADRRLTLFPARRVDNRFSASLAGTFRSLRIGAFAPLARLRWERNRSSVELYDYNRVAGEFGIVSAF